MDSNYNLKTTHDSKYDATSKNVYMYIHSNKPNQVNTWIDSCLEYKEKHNCNLYLNLGGTYDQASVRARQENNDGFTEVKSRSEIGDVYASYYIGYGDKNLFGYGLFGDYGNFNPFNKYLGEDNIGFNPMNNGDVIIISVPPLTEERRRDLAKQAKVEAEDAKIGVRNVRKDSNNEIKKLEKDGTSEDICKSACLLYTSDAADE